MTALWIDSGEDKSLCEFEESDATATATSACFQFQDDDNARVIESIHARAETITPLLKEILEIRPPSHWGINE